MTLPEQDPASEADQTDGVTTSPASMAIGRPPRPEGHRSLASRMAGRVAVVRRYGIPVFSEFVRDCDTNATVFLKRNGTQLVGKYFTRSAEASAELRAERQSWALFHDRSWRMPVVASRGRSILVPRLPDGDRMDMRARTMSPSQRLETAAWALDVILDIYLAGYFHGDFQPHNIWYLKGRPVVTDWSTFAARSADLPFTESADITGRDPAHERRFDPAFDPEDPWSFHNVFGTPLAEAVDSLRGRLQNSVEHTETTEAKLEALDGQR